MTRNQQESPSLQFLDCGEKDQEGLIARVFDFEATSSALAKHPANARESHR